jgi:hypothetical protein
MAGGAGVRAARTNTLAAYRTFEQKSPPGQIARRIRRTQAGYI